MDVQEIKRRLVEALGPERVRDDEAALEESSHDMTELAPVRPALVVSATEPAQVQAVLRLANEARAPVTPRVAGTNLGGLSLPAPGGLVLDLRPMRRILAIHPDEMVAVIEPGVSFQDMRRHLAEHHPGLRLGYPLSPPEVSVVANCLCQGLSNLSLKHGSMDEWLHGVEAVLPTGELVRTGSMAVGDVPFGRPPLPDLTGLFLGFQGTTGVVTKAAVALFPEPPLRARGFILNHSLEGSYEVLRRLARREVCDDLGGLSWPTGKMLFGVERPLERDPAEPEFFLYLDLSAHDAEELALKQRAVDQEIEAARGRGFRVEAPLPIERLVRLEPAFAKFADFPTRLDFLLDHAGGGLTWVGLYGPAARWEAASRDGERLLATHGFPPAIVARPMKAGHFAVLRFILTFDRRDPAELARVRAAVREVGAMALGRGFVPYKTPPWAVRELLAPRVDPGMLQLLGRVRRLLDPAGVMNPGKWEP
ncbi:MAG TPA: FAD-binding oxidoreductase [Myxococcota bacterium]|nr:FAD-binding oxidoreductase [Myxococcota bacterium]HRY92749.1 FAD-binding oxidoreductase [Myxococcota bacterium]